jgi:hypothetical protein
VITPPLGISLAGYYYDRRADGIIDDLHARAVVLSDGTTRAALVVCDLIGIGKSLARRIHSSVEERSGIPANQIMVCCTHTHTGPLTEPWKAAGLFPDEVYLDVLARRAADAVVLADQRRQPASAWVGHGRVENVAFNRRYWMKDGTIRTNPEFQDPEIVRRAGPEDEDLGLLLFRGEKEQPLALISHFAIHPDQVNGCAISADYEGVEARLLKKVLGEDCAVLCPNGCCGDLNHWDFFRPADQQRQGPAAAARTGSAIAGEALKQLPRLKRAGEGGLQIWQREVEIELRVPTAQEVAWAKEIAGEPMREFNAAGLDVVRAHRMLDVHASGASRVSTQVMAIVLGNVAMVGLPGEIFVELGLEIKQRSPFPHTLLFELSNDNIGYILTPKAYAEGGYEATSSPFQPDSGARLVEQVVIMLQQVEVSQAKPGYSSASRSRP